MMTAMTLNMHMSMTTEMRADKVIVLRVVLMHATVTIRALLLLQRWFVPNATDTALAQAGSVLSRR